MFVTVITYCTVVVLPGVTVDGVTALLIERSADGVVEVGVLVACTKKRMVELLFEGFGSVVLADTVAVFVIVVLVDVSTSARMLRVAVELALISPIVHVSVFVEVAYVEVPTVVVALSKVRPAGNVSDATTSVDVARLLFVTVMV